VKTDSRFKIQDSRTEKASFLNFEFSILNPRREAGFTLVELAIVLVIVGLMVGLGAGLMGPLTKRAKLYETKETINAAVESLISYGASNNDLPDTSGFSAAVRNANDVWGRTLSYIVDGDLRNSSLGGICERSSTRLTVSICSDAACSSPDARTNIAFIVLSSGENTNNQTRGTQAVTSTTNVNVYAAEVNVDNYTTDMNRTEPYDDIVKWISLNELRTKAGCTGPQIRILNNELPSAINLNPYNADVYADGGVTFPDSSGDTDSQPDYEWCWQQDPVKGFPTGVTFTCDGTISSSPTCSLGAGNWNQCTSLALGGAPSTGTNTFILNFFVRDNNANMVQKRMVLTVN